MTLKNKGINSFFRNIETIGYEEYETPTKSKISLKITKMTDWESIS